MMRVDVEYLQLGLTKSAKYTKEVKSSEDYWNEHSEMGVSDPGSVDILELGGGFVSASFAYNEANILITNAKEYTHREESDITEFNECCLQVYRKSTVSMMLNGITSSLTEKVYVQTTATDGHFNDTQLRQMANRYLKNTFYDDTKNIHGTIYEAHWCEKRFSEACRSRNSSYGLDNTVCNKWYRHDAKCLFSVSF